MGSKAKLFITDYEVIDRIIHDPAATRRNLEPNGLILQ
jgi:hypothetical protein